jgi:adhesin transport system membrane fusion protein
MLKISNNTIDKEINEKDFESFKSVLNEHAYNRLSRILFGVLLFLMLCLFLPWTQNVSTKGKVTSLKPEQRPQLVVSNIPGRIDRWFVQEGQLVNKGDTMITLTEIKSEYLDSNLVLRIQEQITAKNQAIEAYKLKVEALGSQRAALQRGLGLKLKQTQNKVQQARLQVQADSITYEAAIVYNANIKDLLERNRKLYENAEGPIISKTKWQQVIIKEQEAQAKLLTKKNKYHVSSNKLINAEIELSGVNAVYSEKLAKNQSDRSSASSTLADGYSSLAKLRNQKSNYQMRVVYRTVRAPQDGYITKAIKTGIGGIIKEGEGLLTIMPKHHDLAAELYISALDLPLMGMHHEVNLIFDGWPVVAVPGWPKVSYGTFKGEIVAIDNMISPNGKFRILVSPKRGKKGWPTALRMGSGVKGFALLNDVPLYREFWRQMNGFPADFYDDYQEDHIIKDRKSKNKGK